MNQKKIKIKWPNGQISKASPGDNWLDKSLDTDISIPTGCLSGSCGACEIEANGVVFRACIDRVPDSDDQVIEVEFSCDPYW